MFKPQLHIRTERHLEISTDTLRADETQNCSFPLNAQFNEQQIRPNNALPKCSVLYESKRGRSGPGLARVQSLTLRSGRRVEPLRFLQEPARFLRLRVLQRSERDLDAALRFIFVYLHH